MKLYKHPGIVNSDAIVWTIVHGSYICSVAVSGYEAAAQSHLGFRRLMANRIKTARSALRRKQLT